MTFIVFVAFEISDEKREKHACAHIVCHSSSVESLESREFIFFFIIIFIVILPWSHGNYKIKIHSKICDESCTYGRSKPLSGPRRVQWIVYDRTHTHIERIILKRQSTNRAASSSQLFIYKRSTAAGRCHGQTQSFVIPSSDYFIFVKRWKGKEK